MKKKLFDPKLNIKVEPLVWKFNLALIAVDAILWVVGSYVQRLKPVLYVVKVKIR
jgi:hypothetical protein